MKTQTRFATEQWHPAWDSLPPHVMLQSQQILEQDRDAYTVKAAIKSAQAGDSPIVRVTGTTANRWVASKRPATAPYSPRRIPDTPQPSHPQPAAQPARPTTAQSKATAGAFLTGDLDLERACTAPLSETLAPAASDEPDLNKMLRALSDTIGTTELRAPLYRPAPRPVSPLQTRPPGIDPRLANTLLRDNRQYTSFGSNALFLAASSRSVRRGLPDTQTVPGSSEVRSIHELENLWGFDPNWRCPARNMSALASAASSGDLALTRLLLESAGDPNVRFRENTALMLAAGSGHAEIVQLMVEYGGNVAAVDSKGWSALHIAASNGHSARLLFCS